VQKVGFAGAAIPFMEIPTHWLPWGSWNTLKRKNKPYNRDRNNGMGKIEYKRIGKGCLDGPR
jgi:hypothetical protein